MRVNIRVNIRVNFEVVGKKNPEKTKFSEKIRPPGGARFLNPQASKPLPDRKFEPDRSKNSFLKKIRPNGVRFLNLQVEKPLS